MGVCKSSMADLRLRYLSRSSAARFFPLLGLIEAFPCQYCQNPRPAENLKNSGAAATPATPATDAPRASTKRQVRASYSRYTCYTSPVAVAGVAEVAAPLTKIRNLSRHAWRRVWPLIVTSRDTHSTCL